MAADTAPAAGAARAPAAAWHTLRAPADSLSAAGRPEPATGPDRAGRSAPADPGVPERPAASPAHPGRLLPRRSASVCRPGAGAARGGPARRAALLSDRRPLDAGRPRARGRRRAPASRPGWRLRTLSAPRHVLPGGSANAGTARDNQLELRRLFDGQVGGPGAPAAPGTNVVTPAGFRRPLAVSASW